MKLEDAIDEVIDAIFHEDLVERFELDAAIKRLQLEVRLIETRNALIEEESR